MLGSWGWPSVPDAVTTATLMTAAWIYQGAKAPSGWLVNNEIEAVPLRRISPIAAEMLSTLTIGPIR